MSYKFYDEVGSPRHACCSFEIGFAVAAIPDPISVPVSYLYEPLAPRLCFLLFTMNCFLMVVLNYLNQRLENYEFLEKLRTRTALFKKRATAHPVHTCSNSSFQNSPTLPKSGRPTSCVKWRRTS